ncbi:MAG: NifU N-terminal domain-containing protein [Chloroflexi bacterium]|nr:NifU N-terminal domain-containing protein [Chloroflexota bacterium]MCC6896097.1 NifU N-terminal domain-containing protein [Anaerolineae bacterium]
MSEYVTVETQPTDNPDILEIITNQRIALEGDEVYDSFEAGDEGSPIAQMLFNGVRGLQALTISGSTLLVTRDPDVPWEEMVDEIRDALRDFFL